MLNDKYQIFQERIQDLFLLPRMVYVWDTELQGTTVAHDVC